ncbi:MAG TPA: hypothetical protein VH120_20025, partial [Gemmataceae bacterium]|nr:hypothetical protein [Gemmataceae bacterium]
MTRNRLIATALLAIGTSTAAVFGADPPTPTVPDPAPVVRPEQPPGRIIKIEIGFEPWPLDESPIAEPAPAKVPAPSPSPAIIPATATSPMPTVAPAVETWPAPITVPESPRPAGLSLASLERMALGQTAEMSPPAAGRLRIPLTPVSATEMANADVWRPTPFVDQVVTPSQAPTMAQQYRLLNSVRLHYYHLLTLQRLIAVREELAGMSRDAVTAIEAMTTAGQATKAELLQARIEAREQMAALQSVKAVREAVWHRMAALVNQPDMPVGPLAGDLEQCCLNRDFDAAWSHLLEANPELQAARAEVARRQATLRQNLACN